MRSHSSDPILEQYFFLIRPEKIAFFRFILEGYDGLALLSTIDQKQGLVKVLVPDSRVTELWRLLENLSDQLIKIPS